MEELLRYKVLVDKAMQVCLCFCVSVIVFLFLFCVENRLDAVLLRNRRSGRWKTLRRR